jgi:hypothetical protein
VDLRVRVWKGEGGKSDGRVKVDEKRGEGLKNTRGSARDSERIEEVKK